MEEEREEEGEGGREEGEKGRVRRKGGDLGGGGE